ELEALERRFPVRVETELVRRQTDGLRTDPSLPARAASDLAIDEHAACDDAQLGRYVAGNREFRAAAFDGSDLLEDIGGIEPEIGPRQVEHPPRQLQGTEDEARARVLLRGDDCRQRRIAVGRTG